MLAGALNMEKSVGELRGEPRKVVWQDVCGTSAPLCFVLRGILTLPG
jgi:hypothetical protein